MKIPSIHSEKRDKLLTMSINEDQLALGRVMIYATKSSREVPMSLACL